MPYTVVIPNKVAATNVDIYNRSVKSGSALENGTVFVLNGQSSTSGEGEVWDVTWPTTGSLVGLWMAMSPEIVTITAADGTEYKGINADPRNFSNPASKVFDAIQLQEGDILTITADGFTGAYASGSTHATAAFQEWKLQWRAFGADDALTLKYLGTTYVSIGTGNIDNQRVTAYKMQVIKN
jgi:hypothetical protein